VSLPDRGALYHPAVPLSRLPRPSVV
jgi:hypothetical protein